MTKPICRNCRWWNGDREDWGDGHEACLRIRVALGREEPSAAIYPVQASGVWLEVSRDFSCALHEKIDKKASTKGQ